LSTPQPGNFSAKSPYIYAALLPEISIQVPPEKHPAFRGISLAKEN
jgi:hypothetical protein